MYIDASTWLNLAISSLLPALVALVTAQNAHPGIKAVVLLFLSAASGFLTAWGDAVANSVPFDWSTAGVTALAGFAVAVLSHFGLLGPAGVTGSGGVIARKTWRFGLGGPATPRSASLLPPPPSPHRHEAP